MAGNDETKDEIESGEVEDFGSKYQNLTYFKPQIQLLNLPGNWEEDIILSATNKDADKEDDKEEEKRKEKESTTSQQPTFPKSLYEYDEGEEVSLENPSVGKNIRELLRKHRTPRKTDTSTKETNSQNTPGNDALFNVHIPKTPKRYDPENRGASTSTGGQKRKRNESEQGDASSVATEDDSVKRANRRPPWLKAHDAERGGNCPQDGKLWLHNEILEFVDFISAKPSEMALRNAVVKQISTVVSEVYPKSSTVVFGSVANDLCIPDSDVDLVVFNTPKKAIHHLARAFRAKGMVEYMEVIAKARIPIIKLRLNGSPYTVDISFDQEGGPKTGVLIRSIIAEVPTVRPLVLLIKYFLAQRDLNETYRGGVGSHCCLMTVVSMVQHSRRKLLFRHKRGEIKGQVEDYEDLGSLLLEYLDLYGRKFNFANVTIIVKNGGNYVPKPKKFRDGGRPGLLSLENPEDESLDIGKSSFAIARVRRAFGHAHGVLLSRINSHDYLCRRAKEENRRLELPNSILSSIISVDKILKIREEKFYS